MLNLLWPKTCLSCYRPLPGSDENELICLRCLDSIKFEAGMLENRAFDMPVGFDRLFFACRYNGVVKALIRRFKYDGRDYLAAFFGRLLEECIRTLSVPMEEIDCIVAIPLHAARLREREYNQAQLLASHVGSVFHRPAENALLVRNKLTRTQTGLAVDQRQDNVRGCFTIAGEKSCTGKTLLLVDDVLTTGATASEAARILKNAGAKKVYVITVAH